MKIEISHDTLAKSVYEKASAEDRMRLRVINFIRAKHQFFKEDKTYLSSDELKTIAPYEEQIILTEEEKRFIIVSRVLARKRSIFAGVAVIIIIAILVWLATDLKMANMEASENLKTAQDAQKENQLKIKELEKRDSIQRSLVAKEYVHKEVIKMTAKELQDALTLVYIKNEELKEQKKLLEIERNKLEKERNKLKDDKKDLTEQLKDHDKIKSALSTVDQSQLLSQKAQEILHNREKPTDKQFQEAFRLSRAAWEMSNKNSQAMDLINEIKNEKIPAPNGGFLSNTRPKYTYTHKKIKEMITQLDRKFSYGKLSEEEIKRYLK